MNLMKNYKHLFVYCLLFCLGFSIIDFIKTGDIMLTDNLIKSVCTIAVIAVLETLYSIYEKRNNNN